MARYHHHVYVVELSIDVLRQPRFLRANPHYAMRKPCVYVGMTGLSPDERFDKHKAGIRANRFVRDYGLRLLPELYEAYNHALSWRGGDGGRTRHRASRGGVRGLAGLRSGAGPLRDASCKSRCTARSRPVADAAGHVAPSATNSSRWSPTSMTSPLRNASAWLWSSLPLTRGRCAPSTCARK